jgi:small subunit ribosomal protein S20
MKSSRRKRAVNIVTINKYKRAVKSVRDAAAAGKKDEAQKNLLNAFKQIDKAAKKKVIHKNKAARLKSRLSSAVSGKAESQV